LNKTKYKCVHTEFVFLLKLYVKSYIVLNLITYYMPIHVKLV